MSDIEQKILASNPQAPRITPTDIEANIVGEHYVNMGDAVEAVGHSVKDGDYSSLRLLTICVLTLKNGFTVTGESAVVSPENFNAEIGRMVARRNAAQKIWPLMGYQLRTSLAIQEGKL